MSWRDGAGLDPPREDQWNPPITLSTRIEKLEDSLQHILSRLDSLGTQLERLVESNSQKA